MAKYRFKPNLWLSLLTLLLLSLFIVLGFWQLDRAEQKRQRLAHFESNSSTAATQLTGEEAFVDENWMYRKIQVAGSYDKNILLALDNQVEQGQVGFHIYTPFHINNSDKVILVNRGWVVMDKQKRAMPTVNTPDKNFRLTGMAYLPSEPAFKLGDTSIKTRKQDIVQYIDVKKLAQDLKLDLLPVVMLLDANSQSGFVRHWKIISAPADKSTSYAMQWFSFALLLAGLYIGLNLKREK